MSPKKVFLCGSYHGNNKGDEAILVSILSLLEKHGIPRANITVLTKSPEYIRDTYQTRALSPFRIFALMKAVKKTDVVIIGGGGLFFDYSFWDTLALTGQSQLLFWTGITWLSNRMRKSTLWYGIGVGPLHSRIGGWLVRFGAKRTDAIVVRDQDSGAALTKLGITNWQESIDVVYTRMHHLPKTTPVSDTSPVLIIPRSWKGKELVIQSLMTRIIETLLQRGEKVILSETNHHTDHTLLHGIMERCETSKIEFVCTKTFHVDDFFQLVGSAKYIISMRMHPIIMAALYHRPSLSLGHQSPKMNSAMEMLGLSGLSTSLESATQDFLLLMNKLEQHANWSSDIAKRLHVLKPRITILDQTLKKFL